MKLKYQLFIVLLLTTAALIAMLFAFNSWTFNRGFNNYINQSQTRALESLAGTLAEEYENTGNWNWISSDRSQWRRISSQAIRGVQITESPLPQDGKRNAERNADSDRSKNGRGRGNRPAWTSVLLADAQKNIIAGRMRAETKPVWFPITSEDSDIIGYIGYRKRDRAQGQLDKLFAAQQKENLAWVSLCMVFFSAILAALLAPRIVKPVVTVGHAVSEISNGNYDQRVDANRKDEIGDLSRDVNQLAHTLDQSRTARRKWIAEISHELRTPVAILQGEIEAIEDGIREFDDNSLKSLQTETIRLSRLIQDLHDLSLSDLGALEYRMSPMNIVELIHERLASAEPQRLEADIEITFDAAGDCGDMVADVHRMGQLVDNLLQNSLRYTDKQGHLAINVFEQNNQLNIIWSDSSPGLNDKDLPQLFDPLYRAEPSRNRNNGGAGLGLAIVEKIVHAHQGSIAATHSDAGGLEISLSFPLHHSGQTRKS